MTAPDPATTRDRLAALIAPHVDSGYGLTAILDALEGWTPPRPKGRDAELIGAVLQWCGHGLGVGSDDDDDDLCAAVQNYLHEHRDGCGCRDCLDG